MVLSNFFWIKLSRKKSRLIIWTVSAEIASFPQVSRQNSTNVWYLRKEFCSFEIHWNTLNSEHWKVVIQSCHEWPRTYCRDGLIQFRWSTPALTPALLRKEGWIKCSRRVSSVGKQSGDTSQRKNDGKVTRDASRNLLHEVISKTMDAVLEQKVRQCSPCQEDR